LPIEVTIAELRIPTQVENVVFALQEKRDAFQSIGDLTGDRAAVQPADLLEICELRHLHPV
jgi:hypothetical protein